MISGQVTSSVAIPEQLLTLNNPDCAYLCLHLIAEHSWRRVNVLSNITLEMSNSLT